MQPILRHNIFNLVSTDEAARMLNFNPRSVLQAVYRKKLKPVSPRATLLFEESEIERYAAERRKRK